MEEKAWPVLVPPQPDPDQKKKKEKKKTVDRHSKEKAMEKKENPRRKYQTRAEQQRRFDEECWGPGKQDPGEERKE